MKSKWEKRLVALVLCMVVAISNSSFIFASETVEGEYPQEAEVQTEDETVTQDAAVETYAEESVQPVVEETATESEPVAQYEEAAPAVEEQQEQTAAEAPAAEASQEQETTATEGEQGQETAQPQQMTWSAKVGTATVNVTADAGALPENAQLSVSEITSDKEVSEIEKAVEEKAIEEQFSIKNILSYDIKFLANGSEVQPTTPVQVSVDTPEITSGEDAAVLHVNDKNIAEDMNGTVDGQGNVVFDAPHFSTYVIVQKGDSKVTVTIQHYNRETNKKIYADDVRELPVGGKINDYTKATNWEVDSVVQVETKDGKETETAVTDSSEISVAKDCTIRVYYTAKKATVDGATTFYDYTVKAGNEGSNYYSFNQLGDDATNGQKLTAGSTDQNYSQYQYSNFSVNGKKANEWTGSSAVIKGLLKGLKDDNTVEFNYPEPGFFVDSDATVTVGSGDNQETRYLRKVYKDYKLTFQQTGDTYELKSVKNGSGTTVTTAGEDFFPLDSVLPDYEKAHTSKKDSGYADTTKHNYYFGMRYDVTFKIGDYVGDLNYSFTGDDDLWVLLDGKQVVIDLGGIHNAASSTVDLWKYINNGSSENLTEEQKQQEHTLTILYMERGASASNCSMKFTLPSARISEVSSVPMADLVLQKVNSKEEKLQGARFTLTNKETGEKQTATSVGTDGLAQFTKLRVGEYTLTEDAAPNGYIPSLESWVVKVEEKDGTAIATMYLSDGTTEYTRKPGSYYQILNLTETEKINSSMEYNKTATVTDWDNRKYQINITASSILTDTTTVEKDAVADIVLALDISGSMNYVVSQRTDASYVSIGQFKNAQLDTSKIYYYSNSHYPMVYQSGQWLYYDGAWKTVNTSSSSKVYTQASRLSGVKEAVNAFIASTNTASANSRIGLVSFSTSATKVADIQKVDTNGMNSLIKAANTLSASGGTSPDTALSTAADMLKNSKRDGVPQYVILFTDGSPTGNGNTWNNAEAAKAKDAADKLKEAGVTVYTVGLGLTEQAAGWLDGTKSINYNGREISGIASTDCAYTADDIEQLKEIFKKIQQTTTQHLDISKAEVKDVIDPRFVILDDDGKQITETYPGIENGIKLSNGGTVYYDSTGNQYIVWTDQTIPNKQKATWQKSINVQARDNYIGGNNVPTNISPESKISTGYGDAILPQPKVNVKAELKVTDKEITIYKGDSLPDMDSVLEDMFDLTGNVNRYGVDKNDFHMSWYDENGNSIEEAAISKDSDGTYRLKVTYDAGNPTTESTANTAGNIAGGDTHTVEAVNENDSNLTYGIYAIHVISGHIDITKKLETALTTDQTFIFDVKVKTSGEDEVTLQVPVTVKAGEKEGTYDGEKLSELARGTYTITEVVSEGYVLTDYQIDDEKTDCKNAADDKKQSVVFKLGYEKNKKDEDIDVIKDYQYDEKDGGVLGTVSFTNEKATSRWDIIKVSTSGNAVHLQNAEFVLKDADNKIVYTGKSNENGKIDWMKDNQSVDQLEKGTYTLEETKAPQGYVLSTEKWTIKVTKGGSLVSVSTDKKGAEVEKSQVTHETDTLHLYFKNDVVYDLPSTGHTGIFHIMMSGILLMFAGILIIFKLRGKGVLKR